MKIVAYARVSTEEQASHGISLAAQEAKLRAYADLYGHELVEVIIEGGVSGKTLNRPGLQKALAALRSGLAEGLLVVKLDRLTRSVRDLDTLLEHYFQAFSFLSVQEQFDTSTAAGRLVLNVMASVSQWEREAISERTSAALQHKKTQGIRLGAPALEDVATIARIRQLRSEGMSFQQVADNLTQEGFPTLRGGKWHASTVMRLLGRAGSE